MTAWCALAVRLISVSIFRSWSGSCSGTETEAESVVAGLCAGLLSNNWKVLWLVVWKQLEASVYSLIFLVIRGATVTTQMCFLPLLNDYKAVNVLLDYSCHSSVLYLFSQNYRWWGVGEQAQSAGVQRCAYSSKHLSTQTRLMFQAGEWFHFSSVCHVLILAPVVKESA